MKESRSGEKILAANLRLLAAEGNRHEEKRVLLAAELARMLASPLVGLRERVLRLERVACDFFEEQELPSLSPEERVSFIGELLSVFSEAGAGILPEELLPMRADTPEKISYFRTVYTDEAYEGFAAKMREPTVQYADAFFLSCEDVVSGQAGYCILPCENSDGPLSAMLALADRYGLFRVGGYRAFHADGENATHFGLFARAAAAVPDGDELVLRFSAVAGDAAELGVHLCALSLLGIGLLRTEVQAPEEEERLPFTATVRVERAALTAVLFYLRIFAKQLTLRGLYEENG